MAEHLLVQISDIHLTVDGHLPPAARPRENLIRCLDLIRSSGIEPDVFLLTGDLTDVGASSCYQDLAQIFLDHGKGDGPSVVFLPGNHDDRAAFRAHLLGTEATQAPINEVHWHNGLRIISLDSTIPGRVEGELDRETIAFLRSELRVAAPDGTVVALHHPPIPSPIESMSRLRLRNPADLRAAIAGTDVRIVLSGHNHHEAAGSIGSVPVWVSPASAYRADVTSTETFRGVPGCAFSRIDLSNSDVVVTVVTVPLD
jgi:3',5'-cyclic AMP phosphodiesterase CpdA